MKAHNLDVLGYLKLEFTPTEPNHAVRLQDLAGVGSAKQPIFVTDVIPSSTGNVGSKQYIAGTVPVNRVLTNCVSDTPNVRIYFLADGGNTYSPTVTIDGSPAQFIEEVPGDKRLFQGYSNVTVAASRDVEVVSSTGSTYVVHITVEANGPQMSTLVIGSIPAGQTAVKAGDSVAVSGKVSNDAVTVTIKDYGAASSGAIVLGALNSGGVGFKTFSGTFVSSSRTGTLAIQASAANQLGTPGNTLTSSTTVLMDQVVPVISTPVLTYNNGKTALGLNDTATITFTITNQTSQTFAFSYGTFTGTSTQYLASRTLTVTSAITSSSGGVTITAARASNGSSATKTANVAIMSVAPTGTIEVLNGVSVIEPATAGNPNNIPEYPRLGKAPINITGTQIDTYTTLRSSTANQSISISCSGTEYGFFVYPKALGTATFVDTSNGFPGGWDGASWPADGSFGYTYGPIEIQRNGVAYYLYRTDFAGVVGSFNVTFTNPGLTVGSTAGLPARTVYLLRSGTPGAEYEIRFVLNQNQYCVLSNSSNTPYPHTDTPPIGNWKANTLGEEIATTTARGTLIVTDANAVGKRDLEVTFTGVVMQNDAGMVATVAPFYYKIVGFKPREVTFAAFSQIAPIGCVVKTSSKVIAYYIGAPLPLTFRTDKSNVQKAFTICDSNGNVVSTGGTHIWLNDVAFAQSNTSGTLSVSIEETL